MSFFFSSQGTSVFFFFLFYTGAAFYIFIYLLIPIYHGDNTLHHKYVAFTCPFMVLLVDYEDIPGMRSLRLQMDRPLVFIEKQLTLMMSKAINQHKCLLNESLIMVHILIMKVWELLVIVQHTNCFKIITVNTFFRKVFVLMRRDMQCDIDWIFFRDILFIIALKRVSYCRCISRQTCVGVFMVENSCYRD